MKVGSLFSGIGGFDLGLERAGMTVAWQCEIDKDARKVLCAHWPDTPMYDDVTALKGADVAGVDVLVGGFPCQDLSVAGRRAGLAGERSGLFHEFMRLAGELAPCWVLIENVPGLLSSGHDADCASERCGGCEPGADMATVLGTLADLGYGWCYRVLDAQYLGVAQRRRRVFIVGCLGDAARAAQVLLESSSCDGDSPPSRATGEGVAGTLGGGAGRRGFCDDLDRSGAFIPEVARCLTASNERINGETETFVPIGFMWQAGGNNDASGAVEHDLTPTLPKSQTIAVAYNPYRTLEKDGSITSGFAERPVVDALHGPTGNKEPLVLDLAVRRLTPVECERLQGFPDDWTAGLSDSARYRTLGNAVCVPVAAWIAHRIVAVDALEVAA